MSIPLSPLNYVKSCHYTNQIEVKYTAAKSWYSFVNYFYVIIIDTWVCVCGAKNELHNLLSRDCFYLRKKSQTTKFTKKYKIERVCVEVKYVGWGMCHIKVSNLNYVKCGSLTELSPAEHKIPCTVKWYYRASPQNPALQPTKLQQKQRRWRQHELPTLKNWPTTINNCYMNLWMCRYV